jgi:hypothetical protein
VTKWLKNSQLFGDAFLHGRMPEGDRTSIDLSPVLTFKHTEHLSTGIENAQDHKVDDEVIF